MTIYNLGEIEESVLGTVGGKARGLDFLKRNGFDVADGFAVTGLSELDFAENADELYAAFDRLGAETVAVRSSASDEDGDEFSNAGQYETVLNVRRDEFGDAIKKCLRSLGGARAAAYAKKMSDGGGAVMNIVVQKMIDARFAGVVFTVDPNDADSVLIEAVEGLGEALVSGEKESMSFSVPRAEYTAKSSIIPDSLLRSLYDKSLEIEKAFGRASDIEWAVDGDGRLVFLQLRPITAVAAPIDELDPPHSLDNHLLTSRNIGEMLPGAITPLSISTSVHAIDYGMRYMLYKVGAIKSMDAVPDYTYTLSVDGHLFIDMTELHRISKSVAVTSPAAMNLSIMGEFIEDFPPVAGRNKFFAVKLVNAVKFAKYLFSSEKAKKRLDGIVAELLPKMDRSELEDLSAAQLYKTLDENVHYMDDALCEHYKCSSYSGAMNSGLYMTLADSFPSKNEYQAFMSGVLSAIDGIESADIVASLQRLARAVLTAFPDALGYGTEKLYATVTDSEYPQIKALYDGFAERHGHRSIKESEMRSKAWKNDIPSLMNYLHVIMSDAKLFEKSTEQPPDIKALSKRFKGTKKSAFKFLAKSARQAVVDREYSKSRIIRVFDAFKDGYALLAKKLTADGVLADEDSIYFLTHAEIGRLMSGDVQLKKKALARRKTYAEQESLRFDDVYIGKPVPPEDKPPEGARTLSGVPVFKGKVKGRARVVNTPDDARSIEKGEIMVAPFTDIGFSPYYSELAALVTEVGSALSHGAVVAREYMLPTIVNVKRATVEIKTGDLISVDGDAGTVTVLDGDGNI